MITPWQEITRTETYKKYSRKVEQVDFRLPDGSESDFYIKAEGPAASVVALTEDDRIITVKQFRPGPKRILHELPGGYVEDSEQGLEAMRRELLEESGYEGELELVTMCLDDAYSTMERYCYVARGCRKVGEPQNTATEQCEVVLLPVTEFRNLLRSGQMTDVEVGYLGLDHLGLL